MYLVGISLLASACLFPSDCAEDDGQLVIELDGSALSEPGSLIEVCLNDLCNPVEPGSTEVSVGYAGSYPTYWNWTVSQVAEETTTVAAEGGLEVGCSSEPQTYRIEVDASGDATIERSKTSTQP